VTKEELHRIIQEEFKNEIMLEGITSWLVDKVASGFKSYVNKKTGYQYDALVNDKEFKSLASKYGYKDEEQWAKKARELINKDPKRFADILAYDVKKGAFGKYYK
jgi:hypothetical protein